MNKPWSGAGNHLTVAARRWGREPSRVRATVSTLAKWTLASRADLPIQVRAIPKMRPHSASGSSLNPDIAGDRVRDTRALMIEIPAGRSRKLVLARGKPGLGYAPLMKIVRR